MCKKLIALFLSLVTAYMFFACDSEPVCDTAVSIKNSATALMDGVIPATTPEKTIEHVKVDSSNMQSEPAHMHQYVESVVAPTCIHAVMQVLHEPGKKPQTDSFMWLYRTSGDADKPVVLYEYQPGRGAKHPKELLNG